MPKPEPPRIAVIGAGPIGIEAALYAKACGLAGGGLRSRRHRRSHPPLGPRPALHAVRDERHAAGPGDASPREAEPRRCHPTPIFVTGREFRDAYLVPLARVRNTPGEPLPRNRRAAGRSRLRPAGERSGCSCATARGRSGSKPPMSCSIAPALTRHPDWLGDGNIPAVGELGRPAAHRQWASKTFSGERKGHYAGKSIVLVGDGYSAATTICMLADAGGENTRHVGVLAHARAARRTAAAHRRTTRSRNATGSRRKPTRSRRAATATSSSTRRRCSTRCVPRAGQGLPRRGPHRTASRCRGRWSA